jgi:hypothetical protein
MREEDIIKVIVLPTGIEVIGKVHAMTDHTVTMINSCILPDTENLILIGDYIIYSKQDKVTYNRDMLVAEYEPSDEVVELYMTLLNHDAYKMSRELVKESLKAELMSMTNVNEEVLDRMRDVVQKKVDKMTGPKVMEVKDVLAQIQEKTKKKLN